MSLIKWTGSGSGSWSTGGNWSTGAAPLSGDDVQIEPANPLTVTYGAGTLLIDSLVTDNAAFNVTGGLLGIANGYSFGGNLSLSAGGLRLVGGAFGDQLGTQTGSFSETGGTLTLLQGAFTNEQSFSETGGTITIGNGIFTDDAGSGTFSGLVSGGGQFLLQGTATLASGFTLSVANTEISGNVLLNESLAYANDFLLAANGTLSLASSADTLSLSGAAGLNGTLASGGVVAASGTGHLNGLVLDNGVLLSISGTYTQTGNIVFGQSGFGTIAIAAGGALRIADNASMLAGPGGGEVLNNGLLTKVGGASVNGVSTIYADLVNSATGTINVANGVLAFDGPSSGFTNTLAGTITGLGTAEFGAGNFLIGSSHSLALTVDRVLLAGSTSMTLTTSLSYGGDWDQTGGTLVVGSPGQSAGALTLSGEAALDGGLLKGTGTVLSSGATNLGAFMDIEGNLQMTFKGPVSQTGTIFLANQTGSIDIATISAGDTWSITGSSAILGFNGQIDNVGTFAKSNGAGDSVVQSGVINTGTLAVNTGMLTLSGVGTLGGSVTGAAALDISGAYAFASGLSLTVGEVILDQPNQANEVQASLAGNLTYANRWAQDGGTLALNGNTLTLSGVASLLAGAVEDTGTVLSTGPAILGENFDVLQGAKLQFNGATDQTGNVILSGGSTSPTLAIGPGGTYTMDAGADLGGQYNSIVGTVLLYGTLQASGAGVGGPANVIAAALVDNGKILLNNGEMQFLGPLTGTGSVTLSNGATLDLTTSTSTTNAIGFGAGGGVLYLTNPDNYAGTIAGFATGDVVELGGFAFPSSGSSIGLAVSGDTVIITEPTGQSTTLTFSAAQTLSLLTLGEGPHDNLALIHI